MSPASEDGSAPERAAEENEALRAGTWRCKFCFFENPNPPVSAEAPCRNCGESRNKPKEEMPDEA